MSASIITPPDAWWLTTLAMLKAELGSTITASDDALCAYIAQASRLISSYCDRIFARAQWEEVYRLRMSRRRSLLLSQRPVVEIESLFLDGLQLDVTALDCDTESGILHPPRLHQACEHWHANRIAVVYTAGYLLPGQDQRDLPDDVERACLITARGLYFAPERGDPLIRSESEQGVGGTSYLDPIAANGGLPADAAAMLAGYMSAGGS